MNGFELRRDIASHRAGESIFIRWWRRENDFVDYEMLDKFLASLDGNQEFAGYELLDMESMWQALQRFAGNRVAREHRTHGEVITWHSADMPQEKLTMPFKPESLMLIFDKETRGDTLQ